METRSGLAEQPLDANAAWEWLAAAGGAAGAVVLFSGQVRDEDGGVQSLFLEQYPQMSEAALRRIVAEVGARWSPVRLFARHRTGWMEVGDTIVLVGVAAAHRGDAFQACECLMDRVKTEVPLWKKVRGEEGEHWVPARQRDLDAAARWKRN